MFFSSFFLFTDVIITFCFIDNDCNIRNTTNKNDRKQTLPAGILWYFGRCNHSLFTMKNIFENIVWSRGIWMKVSCMLSYNRCPMLFKSSSTLVKYLIHSSALLPRKYPHVLCFKSCILQSFTEHIRAGIIEPVTIMLTIIHVLSKFCRTISVSKTSTTTITTSSSAAASTKAKPVSNANLAVTTTVATTTCFPCNTTCLIHNFYYDTPYYDSNVDSNSNQRLYDPWIFPRTRLVTL